MKTFNKIAVLTIFTVALTVTAKAQQGFGTSNPAPSSVIDMTATNKGALLPRVALTSTIVAAPVNLPANALTVFNTATAGTAPNNVTPGYYYWSTPQSKWVRMVDQTSLTEPWQVQGGTAQAVANWQSIYQTGSVAVGDFSGTTSTKKMEVKGDFKSLFTNTTTGNTMAMEVNSPLGLEATGGYWMTPGNRIHAFVADAVNVRAVAQDNLAAPTKASNFEVGLDAVNIYSKHPDNSKQATLELNALNSQFALYANQYSTNVGSMVKSDGASGLLLYHGGSSGTTSTVNANDRTQVTIQKGTGVTFLNYDATGSLTGQYTFPRTNGTNGQVLTKSTGNNIIWSSPSAFFDAQNGLTKNTTDGKIELGGTLYRKTEIITTDTKTLALKGLAYADEQSVLNDGYRIPVLDPNSSELKETELKEVLEEYEKNTTLSLIAGAKLKYNNEKANNTDVSLISADANNALKAGTDNGLFVGTEPWNVIGSSPVAAATSNTESIYQSGKVAINATTIPDITAGTVTIKPTLHVNGDISTTGKLWTTNSVYADYVFEKYFAGKSAINPNYEFKSLNYVKDFVKANNHLPGVTAIADLKKANNGYTFDVTQLSIQSLEKIEELYLHTLEQQDKIDAQQAEIEKLKKEAAETQKRLQRLEQMLLNKN